jgi:hypothetical protein
MHDGQYVSGNKHSPTSICIVGSRRYFESPHSYYNLSLTSSLNIFYCKYFYLYPSSSSHEAIFIIVPTCILYAILLCTHLCSETGGITEFPVSNLYICTSNLEIFISNLYICISNKFPISNFRHLHREF